MDKGKENSIAKTFDTLVGCAQIIGTAIGVIALLVSFLALVWGITYPERAIEVVRVISGEPTATSVPPTNTLLPPTDVPTATPTPPTPTPVPPTDTPPPTSTPPPTNTPTPIPLDVLYQQNLPIPIEQTEVIFREDFSNPQSGWLLEEAEYKDSEMALKNKDNWHPIWGGGIALAYPHLRFDNFILEVDARWSGGAVGGHYGVLFRYRGDEPSSYWYKNEFYDFVVGNDGRYSAGKWVDGERVVLLEGFLDALGHPGDINRIHIEANGPNMRFFINDQFLGNISDVEHDSGDIALTAQKPEGTQFFEASFDNVIIARHP
jgi:hypothetical protein